MDCKILDAFESIKTSLDFKNCENITNVKELFKCAYKLAGFKDNQAEVLYKLLPAYSKCSESSIPSMKSCLSWCPNGDQSCSDYCSTKREENAIQCFTKQLNIKSFDSRKAVKCSSECTQDSVSELYDCDYKCKELIYKKFNIDDRDKKLEGTPIEIILKPTSKQYNRTSSSITSSSKQSGVIYNLSVQLISILTLITLFEFLHII